MKIAYFGCQCRSSIRKGRKASWRAADEKLTRTRRERLLHIWIIIREFMFLIKIIKKKIKNQAMSSFTFYIIRKCKAANLFVRHWVSRAIVLANFLHKHSKNFLIYYVATAMSFLAKSGIYLFKIHSSLKI